MDLDKKPSESTRSADDNVDHSARYDKDGNISRDDERDRKDSTEQWNAEDSRTGRDK